MEAIGGAEVHAHQVTCNPAAPCSHQAGLRTSRAQLFELTSERAFPLAQWLSLLQAMTGVPISLITVAGAVQESWRTTHLLLVSFPCAKSAAKHL